MDLVITLLSIDIAIMGVLYNNPYNKNQASNKNLLILIKNQLSSEKKEN